MSVDKMQESSTSHVKSPYDLPTYQRRLRHVRSITLRNLQCKSYKGKDITKLQVYFTVHVDDKLKEFYKSEEIHGSLNPSWQSFDISRFEDEIDIQTKSFVLRIWVQNGGVKHSSPHLLIDWTINLSGLMFFSDKLQHDKYKYIPNMVLVGMFDKYFIAPQTPMSPDRDVLLVGPGVTPRSSYTINSLSRIYTVLRAISQMQASVKRVHKSIEDKLLDSHEKNKKCSGREDLLLRVSQMKSELAFQMNKLQHQRDVGENCRKAKEEKSHDLKERFQQLERSKATFDEKRKTYFQTREKYIKENYQLLIRRKQLISELTTYIYPITEVKERRLCICGVHLPNSEDFQGRDDTMCAAALGYTCHLVAMMSQVLDFPVRYPMDHQSSKSMITDHIHAKLTEKDKTFPLFLKGKEKFQFNYGVFLLNKNISQLRFYCGLGTTDLRMTLPNIKSMLETRLGIQCEGTERPRLDIRDTNSLGSAERDETVSSLMSGGKNSATHPAEDALEIALRNGDGTQEHNKNPNLTERIHSRLPVNELSSSKEDNIPSEAEDMFRPSSQDGFFKLTAIAFGTESVGNSSNGSYTEQSNGMINYDKNFSLSPSPGSTDNNLLLDPTDIKSSGSPTSLQSDKILLSEETKNGGKTEVAPPSDKPCDKTGVLDCDIEASASDRILENGGV